MAELWWHNVTGDFALSNRENYTTDRDGTVPAAAGPITSDALRFDGLGAGHDEDVTLDQDVTIGAIFLPATWGGSFRNANRIDTVTRAQLDDGYIITLTLDDYGNVWGIQGDGLLVGPTTPTTLRLTALSQLLFLGKRSDTEALYGHREEQLIPAISVAPSCETLDMRSYHDAGKRTYAVPLASSLVIETGRTSALAITQGQTRLRAPYAGALRRDSTWPAVWEHLVIGERQGQTKPSTDIVEADAEPTDFDQLWKPPGFFVHNWQSPYEIRESYQTKLNTGTSQRETRRGNMDKPYRVARSESLAMNPDETVLMQAVANRQGSARTQVPIWCDRMQASAALNYLTPVPSNIPSDMLEQVGVDPLLTGEGLFIQIDQRKTDPRTRRLVQNARVMIYDVRQQASRSYVDTFEVVRVRQVLIQSEEAASDATFGPDPFAYLVLSKPVLGDYPEGFFIVPIMEAQQNLEAEANAVSGEAASFLFEGAEVIGSPALAAQAPAYASQAMARAHGLLPMLPLLPDFEGTAVTPGGPVVDAGLGGWVVEPIKGMVRPGQFSRVGNGTLAQLYGTRSLGSFAASARFLERSRAWAFLNAFHSRRGRQLPLVVVDPWQQYEPTAATGNTITFPSVAEEVDASSRLYVAMKLSSGGDWVVRRVIGYTRSGGQDTVTWAEPVDEIINGASVVCASGAFLGRFAAEEVAVQWETDEACSVQMVCQDVGPEEVNDLLGVTGGWAITDTGDQFAEMINAEHCTITPAAPTLASTDTVFVGTLAEAIRELVSFSVSVECPTDPGCPCCEDQITPYDWPADYATEAFRVLAVHPNFDTGVFAVDVGLDELAGASCAKYQHLNYVFRLYVQWQGSLWNLRERCGCFMIFQYPGEETTTCDFVFEGDDSGDQSNSCAGRPGWLIDLTSEDPDCDYLIEADIDFATQAGAGCDSAQQTWTIAELGSFEIAVLGTGTWKGRATAILAGGGAYQLTLCPDSVCGDGVDTTWDVTIAWRARNVTPLGCCDGPHGPSPDLMVNGNATCCGPTGIPGEPDPGPVIDDVLVDPDEDDDDDDKPKGFCKWVFESTYDCDSDVWSAPVLIDTDCVPVCVESGPDIVGCTATWVICGDECDLALGGGGGECPEPDPPEVPGGPPSDCCNICRYTWESTCESDAWGAPVLVDTECVASCEADSGWQSTGDDCVLQRVTCGESCDTVGGCSMSPPAPPTPTNPIPECCEEPTLCDFYVMSVYWDCDEDDWSSPSINTQVPNVPCGEDGDWVAGGDACTFNRSMYVPAGDPTPDPGTPPGGEPVGCCPEELCDLYQFSADWNCDTSQWDITTDSVSEDVACGSDVSWSDVPGACADMAAIYVPAGDPAPDPGTPSTDPSATCCLYDKHTFVAGWVCDFGDYFNLGGLYEVEVGVPGGSDTGWTGDACTRTKIMYVPTGDPAPDPGTPTGPGGDDSCCTCVTTYLCVFDCDTGWGTPGVLQTECVPNALLSTYQAFDEWITDGVLDCEAVYYEQGPSGDCLDCPNEVPDAPTGQPNELCCDEPCSDCDGAQPTLTVSGVTGALDCTDLNQTYSWQGFTAGTPCRWDFEGDTVPFAAHVFYDSGTDTWTVEVEWSGTPGEGLEDVGASVTCGPGLSGSGTLTPQGGAICSGGSWSLS